VLVSPKIEGVKHFSITADMWTSCAKHSYCAVTVHYINRDFELNCHLIETREFPDNTVGREVCSVRQTRLVRIPDSHTADNIVDELKGVLSDWSLPQQGIAATTDNGANII